MKSVQTPDEIDFPQPSVEATAFSNLKFSQSQEAHSYRLIV